MFVFFGGGRCLDHKHAVTKGSSELKSRAWLQALFSSNTSLMPGVLIEDAKTALLLNCEIDIMVAPQC